MDNIDQVLIALRRIIRAIDLHSKKLAQHQGLTVPQLIVLKEINRASKVTVGEIADAVSLSSATITCILIRLESRGFIQRNRSISDKRRVNVVLTDAGQELLKSAPSLLQEQFIKEFEKLKDWEQTLILSSLQKVARLMDAKDLDAAPVLAEGPIAPPEISISLDEINQSMNGNTIDNKD